MKKFILLTVLCLPLAGLAQEKWNLGLVELDRQGDPAYSSLLLRSLETSLVGGGQYQVRVYEDRAALFRQADVADNGQRRDLMRLASRLDHEFLISGQYFIQGEDIYILLYAVDNAYQQVRYMKSYTGKTDADIFDLIESIAADFSIGLQQALPQAEPGVIIEYRKQLRLVSEARKFPRTMMQSFSLELQVLKADLDPVQAGDPNIETVPPLVEGQGYLDISFFADRWYFGFSGPILPVNAHFLGNDVVVQGVQPRTKDIRPMAWIGYAFLDRLYISLGVGMRIFRAHPVASPLDPILCITPLFSYTPSRFWKLDFSPGSFHIMAPYFRFNPLRLNAHYFFNETWGIQAYIMGTWLEYDAGNYFIVANGPQEGSNYTGATYGLSLGLGVSYRLGIDN